jgi:hypothetical protein
MVRFDMCIIDTSAGCLSEGLLTALCSRIKLLLSFKPLLRRSFTLQQDFFANIARMVCRDLTQQMQGRHTMEGVV